MLRKVAACLMIGFGAMCAASSLDGGGVDTPSDFSIIGIGVALIVGGILMIRSEWKETGSSSEQDESN